MQRTQISYGGAECGPGNGGRGMLAGYKNGRRQSGEENGENTREGIIRAIVGDSETRSCKYNVYLSPMQAHDKGSKKFCNTVLRNTRMPMVEPFLKS